VTICSGETYKWAVNGTDYTVGGTFSNNDGCTANQELVLTVTLNQLKNSHTICSGETYNAVKWNDYTVGGTYLVTNETDVLQQELVLTVTLNQPVSYPDNLFW
jgi:hypothetical protein